VSSLLFTKKRPVPKDKHYRNDLPISQQALSGPRTTQAKSILPIVYFGFIARYETDSVFHIRGECRHLKEQIVTFPKAINDDVIDAAAYQLQ